MNGRKTTVTEVPHGWMRFWAGMVVLMTCLSLFCSDARAMYTIFATGNSGVYGLSGDDVRPATGSEFGTVSAVSSSYDAYGLYGKDHNDVEISGDFGVAGSIIAQAAQEHAYGLYSDAGSITTDALNGTIVATAGYYRAVGLFTVHGSIKTGDIGGTITASAGGSSAFGLRNDYDTSITTGNITGVITAVAGGDRAYGFRSYGTIYTGDIDGTITATANGDNAYGLYSSYTLTVAGDIGSNALISAMAGGDNAAGLYSENGSISIVGNIDGEISATAQGAGNTTAYGIYAYEDLATGAINGKITAEMTNGSGAYALRAGLDLTVNGNISETAEITAKAEDSAYGLYSGGPSSIHITGDIGGMISAEATDGDNAYAMYSSGDITVDGDIGSTALITATAGQDNAAGLASGDLLTTGAIRGEITADANNYAAALYSYSDMTINGDIGSNALISAMAGDSNAAGLFSENGSITTGAIRGEITADANNYAAAMYAGSDLMINDDIGSNAQITATAGDSNAYGLFSGNGSITTRTIRGTISANANGSDAYALRALYIEINGDIGSDAEISATATDSNAVALYSSGDLMINGDIGSNALISATAGQDNAAGLTSGGLLTTGAIRGEITADANNYAAALYSYSDMMINGDIGSNAWISATAGDSNAAGLFSENGSITTVAIRGKIYATTTGSNAYGLRSYSDMTINGDIGSNAEITATATNGSNAYALYADPDGAEADLTINGDIKGKISADANGSNAYALYSSGDLTINGDIGSDAEISATAGQNYAVGLYSDGTLTTGAIRGTIDANAGVNMAYGILSYGPMDITIDGGTVSAVAHGGTNFAAIQSGGFGSGVGSQPADDLVEIVAGSTIVGDIDLAFGQGDYDVLTLSGDTGSTTLNDDIWNVENIYITGGTWSINGTVYNNENGIALDGGILKGTGTLGSLNVGNGTLAPGGSIGTITIDGNLTFGPGSTFEVEVDKDGNGDSVDVTGEATLDGTIHAIALNWPENHLDYDTPFSVTVINAAGGVNDEFVAIVGGTAFLLFDVDYSSVILNVDQITDFAYYATTKNQHSVGDAFNYLDPLVTGGDMRDVIDEILMLPDGDAVNNAYNQIMPQDALGQPEIIRNAMNQYSESVFGRMDNVRNGRQYAMSGDSRYLLASASNSAALPPKTDDWMPFAKGFGVWGDRDAESDIAGYQYNIYGLTGGVDKLVSENTLIGISVGGSRANVDYSQSGTSADIDSMFCSLYGSYFKDDWHIGLTAAYAHSWYDSKRGIHFGSIDYQAESDHQGNSYSAAVELGKNFGGSSMILEPVAGLGYTLVQESGYKEKGADSLNLKVDSATTDGIYSKLGIRAAKEFRSEKNPDMIFVPRVSVFWIHDFADRVDLSSAFVGGGSFTTEGREPVRDMFNIGAGLNVYYNKNLRLFIDYGWQSASSFNSDTVQLGAQWSF